ncbi:DNA helicase UvrD [Candidatus Kuenenbacteria bacterium HGW-Kuenenbacteria-1]|uniref:DNA helicase UvrD n=1 Tax=Candidatus Kuenenbacteria bacterium HGW-Kuenenbacteria-1 TaxID=2013812 RepID=A0A2N1UNM4_9BACT|nr:MAG: DNA helicase UvrD [Candidatus Kuenenbacteria bacterium HGW-Kuenenbacteria-1]
MNYIADFHLHSKYSRATSQLMDLEHFNQWAKIKGIDILSVTDFTHPIWFNELKKKLEPSENEGLFTIKKSFLNNQPSVKFIFTTEISCIYTKNNRGRRIHILIFAPNLQIAEKINKKLSLKGNLKSDGRPILGLDAKELAKIILDISEDCLIVPAHVWTPWFSIFGSKFGFDSIEECFEELTPYIYSIETGLCSDPAMNHRLSALDKITLLSNSDAHSLQNLGREANIFELKTLNYQEIIKAIRQTKNSKSSLLQTIEFFPEQGKYYFDGHRKCQINFSPKQTKKYHASCPKCKKPLNKGVLYRVEELADRSINKVDFKKFNLYKKIIPLQEIIANIFKQGKNSKKVEKEYFNLIKQGGNEFNVLLNLSYKELKKITSNEIVEMIKNMREEKIIFDPGYDGVYGKIISKKF